VLQQPNFSEGAGYSAQVTSPCSIEPFITALPGEQSFFEKMAKKQKIHVHHFAGNAIALTAIFARRPD
jgi:hypothetical protein